MAETLYVVTRNGKPVCKPHSSKEAAAMEAFTLKLASFARGKVHLAPGVKIEPAAHQKAA